MKLERVLNNNQIQSQTMYPIMGESLRILQYSAQKLNQFIKQEIEDNPFLEYENDVQEVICESNLPFDWKSITTKKSKSQQDDNLNFIENVANSDITLHQYLIDQIELSSLEVYEKRICSYIAYNLDDNGYLHVSKFEISDLLGISRRKISEMLSFIHTLDPIGVGARSLRECLLIQLKRKELLNPAYYKLVVEQLGNIARKKYKVISDSLGIDIKKVISMCNTVRSLEPKPGRNFSAKQIKYIIPDIEVSTDNNWFLVNVSNYSSPNLKVSNSYEEILSNCIDTQVIKYAKEKINRALVLIKNINMRRDTLYKTAKAIVEYQSDFFIKGVLYLKPLTLKKISEVVDLHESTVSRAIQGKYIQTNRGVFELRYFFSSGFELNNGTSVSVKSIKSIIAELVYNEDKNCPLSDSSIVKILNSKGLKISRRTVAKYREECGISNSFRRKE